MFFFETRGNDGVKAPHVEFTEAILSPSASFGGLYAPKELPQIPADFLQNSVNDGYRALCSKLLTLCDIDVDSDTIVAALALYDGFDTPEVAPVVKIEDNLFVCELWHGPTRAFKDMALQPFGLIFSHLAAQSCQNYLVMTATSGDTGPAALKTFENRPFVKVTCLYPEGGTSEVQKLQMVSMDAPNLCVIGIDGSFDDAQNALKRLLANHDFKAKLREKHIELSAANSVNFGRIIFQIMYHFYAYLRLVKKGEIACGEPIDIIVPSGNFGNALGGYYAKKMGLPVATIKIASNANNVLTELINTGVYDLRGKALVKTISPAMDILISSNVERVLFDKLGDARTKELMDALAQDGFYKLSESELKAVREDFDAVWGDDEFSKAAIKKYADKGYLMCPHTALCLKAHDELPKSRKTVMYSTAEWTKFAPCVWEALSGEAGLRDSEAIRRLKERCKVSLPPQIEKLLEQSFDDKAAIGIDAIEAEILEFLEK